MAQRPIIRKNWFGSRNEQDFDYVFRLNFADGSAGLPLLFVKDQLQHSIESEHNSGIWFFIILKEYWHS